MLRGAWGALESRATRPPASGDTKLKRAYAPRLHGWPCWPAICTRGTLLLKTWSFQRHLELSPLPKNPCIRSTRLPWAPRGSHRNLVKCLGAAEDRAARPLGAGQAPLPRVRTHVPHCLSLVIVSVMPGVFLLFPWLVGPLPVSKSGTEKTSCLAGLLHPTATPPGPPPPGLTPQQATSHVLE